MFDIECFLDWRPFSFDEGDGDAARSDHGKMLMMIALFLGGLGAAQWAPSSFFFVACISEPYHRASCAAFAFAFCNVNFVNCTTGTLCVCLVFELLLCIYVGDRTLLLSWK